MDASIPTDLEILHYIDSLSSEELAEFKQYRPKDLKHYNRTQLAWIHTARYYAAQHLNLDPSDLALLEELQQHHTLERFRAFYCLRYPEHVEEIQISTDAELD